MAQKKSFLPVLLLILLLLVGAGGYYYWSQMQAQQAPTPAAQADLDDVDDVADAAPLPQIDVDAALSDRILGDANAPMRISEHSSLTCGHCGAFHKHTFKPFKEKWIDGGKAYLVFSDFPLNAPALHAAMAARCLPDTTRYFEFVQ
ncbi:MAG: thioredoxin domain-containing protein, partial [Bdellovibrionales bacterium]